MVNLLLNYLLNHFANLNLHFAGFWLTHSYVVGVRNLLRNLARNVDSAGA